MDRLVNRFADKLIRAGLADDQGDARPVVGGLDDALVWNRNAPEIETLEKVFDGLNINSLVFLRPRAPYGEIIDFLARRSQGTIEPQDCETRTFLHDLPVIAHFDAEAIITALKVRKSVIVYNARAEERPAIIAHGTVSPEQGFVVASSVCFACFVKFFSDYLAALQAGTTTVEDHDAFDAIALHIEAATETAPMLMQAPYTDEATVYKAITQAGRHTVALGLVDSYFGNVSYCWSDTLYISQTGSSLDDLAGCVDPVPLAGTSSAGITASSELSAHLETIARTGCKAILHGHPKFAVILSMDCPPEERAACSETHRCHSHCSKPRSIENIPIVPGEVGTGPTGLCHTLPKALVSNAGAIVYGHGLFTTAENDFNTAFRSLLNIENTCKGIYFKKISNIRGVKIKPGLLPRKNHSL